MATTIAAPAEGVTLDELVYRHTAFGSFEELLTAREYTPSLNVAVPAIQKLADAYDAEQAQRGDSRRAHRYERRDRRW